MEFSLSLTFLACFVLPSLTGELGKVKLQCSTSVISQEVVYTLDRTSYITETHRHPFYIDSLYARFWALGDDRRVPSFPGSKQGYCQCEEK